VAFDQLHQRFPNDVRYLRHYLECFVRGGITEDRQWNEVLRLVEIGLGLPDVDNEHRAIRDLEHRVAEEHIARSCGPRPEPPKNLGVLCVEKRWSWVLELFEEARGQVQPRGIPMPSAERRFWTLFQLAIQAHFENQDYEAGLALTEEYERARIRVRLTPIPDYSVQHRVIGCLAQLSRDQAAEKLRFWLAHSRNPMIAGEIVRHPWFRDVCSSVRR
jgi:hypothetical protein